MLDNMFTGILIFLFYCVHFNEECLKYERKKKFQESK